MHERFFLDFSNLRLNLQIELGAKIASIRARDMMLVSKTIYSNREIQWCIHTNPKITQSHSHENMSHFNIKWLKSDL